MLLAAQQNNPVYGPKLFGGMKTPFKKTPQCSSTCMKLFFISIAKSVRFLMAFQRSLPRIASRSGQVFADQATQILCVSAHCLSRFPSFPPDALLQIIKPVMISCSAKCQCTSSSCHGLRIADDRSNSGKCMSCAEKAIGTCRCVQAICLCACVGERVCVIEST